MELVAGVDGSGHLLVKESHNLVYQGKLPLLPLGFWKRCEGQFAELT
jgi:hypothetical protein